MALAYAERHPERVTELVLRGIFLLRRSELEWFYQNPQGAGSIYPELWEQYVAPIPPAERDDLIGAYYRRLTSEDRAVRAAVALPIEWAPQEGATSFLRTNRSYVAKFDDPSMPPDWRCRACSFMPGRFFETDDQLLREVGRIRHIPAVMVQGRYDLVCPMRSAWDLHRAPARGRAHRYSRCGTFGLRAGYRARAGARDRPIRTHSAPLRRFT